MRTYNNLPIFLVNVDSTKASISTVSLVDEPAMELPMYCFKEDNFKFSLEDSKHNIITCIVRCDYPIIRLTEDGNPYYIVFNRESTEKLCQRLMTDGFHQCISLDHNHKLIDGIKLQEVFIKDSSKGISPVGFEDAADGSLFGIYHIEDENLWNDCLAGRFGGVSIESYLSLESFNKKIKNNSMSKIAKLKEVIKDILMEFNSLSTDKAELYWEEDTELAVGMPVFVEDNESKIPAPDGEYLSDDNKIKVEGGVVVEIEKKEEPKAEETVEEPKTEELAEETPEETPETVEEPKAEDRTVELEKRISELEAKVEELIIKVSDLSATPASAPVVEEFEQVTKPLSTGDKKLDRKIELAKALKN